MNLFPDSNSGWAALIIVLLPLLIIGAGELVERMRQRDSPFQPAVSTLRVWVVPLLTVWVLARALLDVSADNVFLRFLGSAIIISAATAALSALRVVAPDLADRPRRTGRRPIPRLLLALPRLLLILATLWVLIAGVWGVNLSAALTALGVTSLVISFALQDTLSGIASGFTLLGDQPFAPGDWIESGDVDGIEPVDPMHLVVSGAGLTTDDHGIEHRRDVRAHVPIGVVHAIPRPSERRPDPIEADLDTHLLQCLAPGGVPRRLIGVDHAADGLPLARLRLLHEQEAPIVVPDQDAHRRQQHEIVPDPVPDASEVLRNRHGSGP